jgi:hypothetical protein
MSLYFWSMGKESVNFGDYLSQYICDELGTIPLLNDPDSLLLGVGSLLSDSLLASITKAQANIDKVYIWGSGCRGKKSFDLSSWQARLSIKILSVRGLLTTQSLGLSDTLALGDPALLLNSIYTPSTIDKFAGKSVFIPHISQCRGDDISKLQSLHELSGCDSILLPLISPSHGCLEIFLSKLSSARFVLSISLHGAILSHTYKVPYSYGMVGGFIDIPFKWKDHSSVVGVDTVFANHIGEAEDLFSNVFAHGKELDTAKLREAISCI